MAFDIGNKRILIAGASGGIGAATTWGFAKIGGRVFAASRRIDRVASDVDGKAIALDVLDNAAIEAFFGDADAFDHVVIAAAATRSGSVAGLSCIEKRTSECHA